LGLTNLSTKRQRIAELARSKSGVALSTLHHVLDLEWSRQRVVAESTMPAALEAIRTKEDGSEAGGPAHQTLEGALRKTYFFPGCCFPVSCAGVTWSSSF
jgi:hypothetical protein